MRICFPNSIPIEISLPVNCGSDASNPRPPKVHWGAGDDNKLELIGVRTRGPSSSSTGLSGREDQDPKGKELGTWEARVSPGWYYYSNSPAGRWCLGWREYPLALG